MNGIDPTVHVCKEGHNEGHPHCPCYNDAGDICCYCGWAEYFADDRDLYTFIRSDQELFDYI